MVIRLTVLLILSCLSFDTAAAPANAGSIDQIFGVPQVNVRAVPKPQQGNAVAVQNDGKVVVAGTTNSGSNDDFLVLRYLQNGALDTSFGGAGFVTTHGGNGDDEATAVAVQAEREALDLQKCAFRQGHVGEEFAATMTGAAPFGLWLTLDDHFVQGLVHVSSLPEFVEYDERRHTFTARRSGERFELGDRFDVRVEAVDIVRARIDFRILDRRPAAGPHSGAAQAPEGRAQ